ncbi:MAG: hypothetical protein PW792_16525 [Acidobacteriaceae bacterium]|nr:hypothetical protein [Acidobacteriaceae bacterium]
MTLVRILLGVIQAIVRALGGALLALFSSAATIVAGLLGLGVLVFALFSLLGVGFARRRGG